MELWNQAYLWAAAQPVFVQVFLGIALFLIAIIALWLMVASAALLGGGAALVSDQLCTLGSVLKNPRAYESLDEGTKNSVSAVLVTLILMPVVLAVLVLFIFVAQR